MILFSSPLLAMFLPQHSLQLKLPLLEETVEGNGNPLQYPCLENPMDGGAWWATAHGVVEESDMTEWLHFHFSLSCTGEGNGNPLQYSCVENPRDGGTWWAALSGVAQSRKRLRWLSSSSSLEETCKNLISGNRSLSNNEFLEGIRAWAEFGKASPQISLNPEDLKDEIQRYYYNPSFRKTATLLWLSWTR